MDGNGGRQNGVTSTPKYTVRVPHRVPLTQAEHHGGDTIEFL